IGIIGGTGLDDPDILEDRQEKTVCTPFGSPSDVLIEGKIGGVDCVLLARHGRKHNFSPSNINYRANIWALKEVGCTHVLASTACGSLREEIKPGELVLMGSFIDRTTSRKQTFYDGAPNSPVGVCHIPMEPAYCPATAKVLLESAEALNLKVHPSVVCVVIEGPRFSSIAESRMYRSWGGDIINMTNVPELLKCCRREKKDNSSEKTEENMSTPNESTRTPLLDYESKKYRNLVAFWILGLCNNFGYVVMLSAAHDILSMDLHLDKWDILQVPGDTLKNSSFVLCNPSSTGIILLADILPSLLAKLTAPFLPFLVHVQMVAVVLLATIGFVVVALSTVVWVTIIGVIATSLGSGLGEVTLLSYSSKFDKDVISTWSSGTGAAGILGSLSYAGLTAFVGPSTTILIMVLIPMIMALAFWLLLRIPDSDKVTWTRYLEYGCTEERSADNSPTKGNKTDNCDVIPPESLTLKEKICMIPGLLRYMVPLTLVYLFEYFVNQGLYELIYFPNIWLTQEEQYRWFQVDYQIGAFLSRSSVNLTFNRRIWILAVIQFFNMVFFVFEAMYLFVPSIWIILTVILWEGLLGGATYVNTFYRISMEVSPEKRGFAMGLTSISDAIGIGFAGAIAVPVHNFLCNFTRI
ncbi:hypothetical protein C0J52_22287, partial [Blattella germanica]